MLRTAVAASILTNQPVRIHSIRGALRRPGLNSEDLTVISGFGAASNAEYPDLDIGMREFTFEPKSPIHPVRQKLDVHSHEKGLVPGSALIVLSSLLPVLGRATGVSRIKAFGETHNSGTISYDAFERVSLAVHRKQGLYAFPTLVSPGFGFGAHGEVDIEIEPGQYEPLVWDKRGALKEMRAVFTYHGLPDDAVKNQADLLEATAQKSGWEMETELLPISARMQGCCVTLWAEFEHGFGTSTASLRHGTKLDELSSTAWQGFVPWLLSDAAVDPFLADQMLLPAAFADGRTHFTTSCITKRLQTMAWVIKQFMPIKITVLGREGEPGSITIER